MLLCLLHGRGRIDRFVEFTPTYTPLTMRDWRVIQSFVAGLEGDPIFAGLSMVIFAGLEGDPIFAGFPMVTVLVIQ